MKVVRRSGLRSLIAFFLYSLVLAGGTICAQTPRTASVLLPKNPAAPLKTGATALSEMLIRKGFQVKVASERSPADFEVMVSDNASSDRSREKASDKPESYAVSLSADKRVAYVEGSDATGAMYGEFELAEQIAARPGDDRNIQIKPITKSPFLEVRGVNMFLTVQDVDNPDGAFWSDDYWEKYLDMMARDRYNFLDIHGLCDPVTLTFPEWLCLFP